MTANRSDRSTTHFAFLKSLSLLEFKEWITSCASCTIAVHGLINSQIMGDFMCLAWCALVKISSLQKNRWIVGSGGRIDMFENNWKGPLQLAKW